VCHGVIARIAPLSRVIDLTHAVPPQDVRRGALLLARSVPYMPADAVFLAVIDPGVGSDRRPVAIGTNTGAALVGPDNGVLSLACEAAGGAAAARAIEAEDLILRPTSATFHGRDVFAPAAANLAAGLPLARLGPAVPTASLVRLTVPPAEAGAGFLRCRVIGVDRYGNVELAATGADLERASMGASRPGARAVVRTPSGTSSVAWAGTFGDVGAGEPALLIGSSGWLTIAVNGGRAADRFGLRVDDPVELGLPAAK
jgi:S-adenosylmethionine hydrolase